MDQIVIGIQRWTQQHYAGKQSAEKAIITVDDDSDMPKLPSIRLEDCQTDEERINI